MEEHKVVILGSGIAGMTAGIYLKIVHFLKNINRFAR